jgi:hypothetical protein
VRLHSVGLRIYTKLFEFSELVTLSFIFFTVFLCWFLEYMCFFFFKLLTNGAVRVSPSTHFNSRR